MTDRRLRLPWGCGLLVLMLLIATAPLGAVEKPIRPPDIQAAAGQWPPADGRTIYPASIHIPQERLSQESALDAHPGIRQFLRGQRAWQLSVDPLTGGVDRAFGDGISTGMPEDLEGKDAAARRFLLRHAELFAPGIDLSEGSLTFSEAASVDLPDPAARTVRFDLRQKGLPVLDAGVTLALRDDRVFYVSAGSLAPVTTSPVPRLTTDDAVRAVAKYAGMADGSLRSAKEPLLAFEPVLDSSAAAPKLAHRLVWVVEVKPESARPWEAYIAHVDAHDGTVLSFFPEAQNLAACQADPARAQGTVIGGIRPNRADDPEVRRVFPFLRVDEGLKFVSSDLNGHFPYNGGGVATSLEGDFIRMRCDQCSNPTQPVATPDESGILDFGVGGASQPSPVVGNGLSTPADRTAYFQLNEAYRLMQKWNSAKFSEIESFVNINSTCNAFSSGYMVGFFRAGGNCNNTGEIRDVMQHELGHNWDRTDGNGITDGGMSEWKADTIAVFIGGDACIGESFRLSGGPTSVCSGVRDLDEKSPGRVDHPLTPAQCPTCATLTRTANNCGGGVHCLGEISGQAVWHLYNNLLTGTDYVTGAAIPGANPGFSQEQARWLLERLYVGGGAAMRTWDPTASGASEYDTVLLADDEDGNLANGTPHAAYINAAYSHHEIAESLLVADSANCAALSDPLVTATLERDSATGLPRVRIEWTPTDGSTTFDVYRNTRAGDGFLPLAQNVSAGPVLDSGVATGVTYRYFVAAVRKTGCANVSPGNNIASVTVNLPDVQVASRTIVEVPGAADMDGLIEPGERVRVTLNLKEAGGAAAAADVAATLTSADPTLAPVVAAGPVSYGSVPAGGTVAGPAPFEVSLSPSLPCGAFVHQVASISSTDGCWLDSIDIEIAKASNGCAVTPAAFVEVVPGSPAVVAGSGDGDGIADNCEATTVSYQLRNAGALAANSVVASVASSSAGVTFAPQPSCSLASLAPGQTSNCQYSFSLGQATNSGVPFTITANSAANAAPSQYAFVLPTETNPPAFGTTVFNFDSGVFQGWTVSGGFTSVIVHPFSSPRSLHAGSTAVTNICAKATSPAFFLSPSAPSTLSMQVWGDIEPFTDQWYDRATVHLIDVLANEHVVLIPASGLAYNASGTPDGGLCHNANQPGWAGSFTSWSPVSFDLSPWMGRQIRIELNYGSDEGDDRDGIYFDDVTLTNVAAAPLPADVQSNACAVPEVSAPGAPVALTAERLGGGGVACTWQSLGAGFQYSVYAGSLGTFYTHGAGAISCQGLGGGISCAGSSCALNAPGGSLPAGDLYFLVTATAFGTEGTAGAGTAGERDPLQNSCAP